LDECLSTPNLFNLRYDGGIFIGLYSRSDPTQAVEPYPEGTSVVYITKLHDKKVRMRGSVISVPLTTDLNTLPDG